MGSDNQCWIYYLRRFDQRRYLCLLEWIGSFAGSSSGNRFTYFPSSQFNRPCFVQYAPGYVNAVLPIPNPDNSGSYLYATSGDVGWNKNNNVFLARIPLATILTSLSGSLAAASTAGNWQFYMSTGCAGGDGTNSACWTSDVDLCDADIPAFPMCWRRIHDDLPGRRSNRWAWESWYYPTEFGGPAGGFSRTQAAMASASLQFESLSIAINPLALQRDRVHNRFTPVAAYYNPRHPFPSSLAARWRLYGHGGSFG